MPRDVSQTGHGDKTKDRVHDLKTVTNTLEKYNRAHIPSIVIPVYLSVMCEPGLYPHLNCPEPLPRLERMFFGLIPNPFYDQIDIRSLDELPVQS